MHLRHRLLLVCLPAFLATASFADDSGADHDRAWRAVEAGEILPLSKILAAVEAEFEGRFLEVELEREGKRFAYEVEILTPQGNVIEITLDARDATVIDVEGKGVEAARRKR